MAAEIAIDFSLPLVAPSEDIDIEFKASLPLTEGVGKAKLAKEICALSNYGGGWIVLGRNDDGTYPSGLTEELRDVSQDTINQIAAAYVSPALHCPARWMRPPAIGYDVLVVYVPAAENVPICGLKNGPNDEKGKTVGIRRSVYYTRSAGPVSKPIETPDEWEAVIRRCVLSRKSSQRWPR